jgi:hypothetical protein
MSATAPFSSPAAESRVSSSGNALGRNLQPVRPTAGTIRKDRFG